MVRSRDRCAPREAFVRLTRMEEDTMTYLKKQIVLWQMTCPCICNSEKMHMPPCQRRDLETTV